jgi:sortase A
MPPTRRRRYRLTRTQWLLRCGRCLCFSVAILALGYFGFTLLDARAYQASAKRSLQDEIQTQQQGQVSTPRPSLKDGDVVARLDVPRLGLSVAVLQGTNSRVLALGAGHIPGTALPGDLGNSGIAGHRDTFFRELRDIREKDEIQLQTAAGAFRYEVDWVKVVAPEDLSVLAPSAESALTLVTCYPFQYFGRAPSRFVVHARRY